MFMAEGFGRGRGVGVKPQGWERRGGARRVDRAGERVQRLTVVGQSPGLGGEPREQRLAGGRGDGHGRLGHVRHCPVGRRQDGGRDRGRDGSRARRWGVGHRGVGGLTHKRVPRPAWRARPLGLVCLGLAPPPEPQPGRQPAGLAVRVAPGRLAELPRELCAAGLVTDGVVALTELKDGGRHGVRAFRTSGAGVAGHSPGRPGARVRRLGPP